MEQQEFLGLCVSRCSHLSVQSAHTLEAHRAGQTMKQLAPVFSCKTLCCSGAATTKEEAAEICDALDRSGVVLRVKNLVYLRPLEVAEIIYQVRLHCLLQLREWAQAAG